MSLEEQIDYSLTKERLLKLETYLPGKPKELYQFAEFLANQLQTDITYTTFVKDTVIAIESLYWGEDVYTFQAISHPLVEQMTSQKELYGMLHRAMPLVTKTILSKEIAEKACNYYNQNWSSGKPKWNLDSL